MRLIFLIASLSLVLVSHTLAQDVEFPYNAIVLNDGTDVRSGPGSSHYATHQFEENELVQVFRHDPGGWCAIRPPEKSFSLIPESAAKIIGKDQNGRDVAEILANGTQAWVGTALGPVEKPLWQVKLKKGEQVSIVGRATWPHPSGKSLVWLQIEPPAGEYRWVRLEDLQLPPDDDAVGSIDYSEPPAFENRRRARTGTAPTEFEPAARTDRPRKPTFKSKPIEKSTSAGWKASTRPIPNEAPPRTEYSGNFARRVTDRDRDIARRDEGFVEQATFLQDDSSDPRFEKWDGNTIPGITDVPRSRATPDRFASLDSMERQSRSFVRERTETPRAANFSNSRRNDAVAATRDNSTLMEIENRLSDEILNEPQSWNLTELKFATERAKAVSSDPVEKLALQHVLDKIARCDELRKGYQQASPFSASAVSNPAVAVGANQIYNATGLLKRLASSSGTMDPVYVLQDSLGNVTHEVVGSVGMNLGQYVDKQVGVIGRQGFNQRLKLRHVTVDRVVGLR